MNEKNVSRPDVDSARIEYVNYISEARLKLARGDLSGLDILAKEAASLAETLFRSEARPDVRAHYGSMAAAHYLEGGDTLNAGRVARDCLREIDQELPGHFRFIAEGVLRKIRQQQEQQASESK